MPARSTARPPMRRDPIRGKPTDRLSGLIHRYYPISEIRHVIANPFALGHCAQNFFADENNSPRMITLEKIGAEAAKNLWVKIS